MPFEPGAGAMLSGPALSVSAEAFTPRGEAPHTMAPASILMGGDGAREESLQGKRSSHEPLRARAGGTLGGQFKVGGGMGEFRGNATGGAHGGNGEFQFANRGGAHRC